MKVKECRVIMSNNDISSRISIVQSESLIKTFCSFLGTTLNFMEGSEEVSIPRLPGTKRADLKTFGKKFEQSLPEKALWRVRRMVRLGKCRISH